MPGYTIYRTTAPAVVRLARSKPAAEAGFITLILLAGLALDGLAGIVLTVLENITK
ncbi:hypothetical protein QPK31_24850 [Massilia sp. YIM B02769]|uniref:hypothetical protein n=1 Tax=Massilia sp. YIM B02769 TaxID=3050129 RepID=UPI0025B6DDC3|nr:hypothetical protein [Massilia sp. YIM B02769]MDN4061455.1 hypothetical protein [Massilia sp. YIM B02769]